MKNVVFLLLLVITFSGYSYASQKNKEELAQALTDAVIEYNRGIIRVRGMVLSSNGYNRWMRTLCESFKVTCTSDTYRELLLSKAELLMPSDVIVRAAVHSHWGTTREAVMGNNYFGLMCEEELCGFMLSSPYENIHFSKFNNLLDAVSALALNVYASQTLGSLSTSDVIVHEKDHEGNIISKSIIPSQRTTLIKENELHQYDTQMLLSLAVEAYHPLDDTSRLHYYFPQQLYSRISK